ncbi:LEF-3 [Choristoneura occidentalis granulovirus]|uniref:LEF-3 n=1 Tax=Choristoneura occidentalis granulovirus TaxID=364745 RepID=Q1A4K4_9BBAC|nr:LEF-3 [Choristoneura fumiferana granulovirus]ABC61226.1 LEF-3 [Choristoneura fumiferana granulovirus]
MSKRSAETDIAQPTTKKNVISTDQVVILKRMFQKGAARIENDVIYKLDCRTINKKEQNLVYVDNKKDYDAIVENCSYNFVIEKQSDKRWHLLSFEKIKEIEIELKQTLTLEDFKSETEVLINFFVEGAYIVGNNECIKIFGCVSVSNEYKQCDLIIKLDGPSCFNFDFKESKIERANRALTIIYTKLLNKWSVFQVVCRESYNLNLLVKDNTVVVESDINDILDGNNFNNISYTTNKRYAVAEILTVSRCEYVNKDNPRMMFEFTTENKPLIGSKFNVKPDDANEIESDVISINFENCLGYKFYCVYNYKLNDDNSFINITSVISIDKDFEVKSLFN